MTATALDLRRQLAARSLPLAVALVAVTALSAPTAFYLVRLDELRAEATAAARAVADELRDEVASRPILWQYDSIKIVEHLRAYRRGPDVAGIEVTDRDGRRVELSGDPPSGSGLLWASAPIPSRDGAAGEVWVAMSLESTRRVALLLVVPFLLLGGLLSGLMFGLPIRALGSAEGRIRALLSRLEGSQRELEELNRDLEAQVAARVHELEAAYGELSKKDARLRGLAGRAVAREEAVRRAIGRELHDAVGQVLTAIRINLQLVEQVKDAPVPALDLARRTRELTDSALEEVRRAVEMLGPAVLAEVGLPDALGRHCADVAERTGLRIECEVACDGMTLSPAVETTCYRLVQEALHNSVRHAGASEVLVRVATDGDRLEVSVKDDGRGFAPGSEEAGRGLSGMRERAELLNGSLVVDSAPGEGTTVRASLPLVQDRS